MVRVVGRELQNEDSSKKQAMIETTKKMKKEEKESPEHEGYGSLSADLQ